MFDLRGALRYVSADLYAGATEFSVDALSGAHRRPELIDGWVREIKPGAAQRYPPPIPSAAASCSAPMPKAQAGVRISGPDLPITLRERPPKGQRRLNEEGEVFQYRD